MNSFFVIVSSYSGTFLQLIETAGDTIKLEHIYLYKYQRGISVAQTVRGHNGGVISIFNHTLREGKHAYVYRSVGSIDMRTMFVEGNYGSGILAYGSLKFYV